MNTMARTGDFAVLWNRKFGIISVLFDYRSYNWKYKIFIAGEKYRFCRGTAVNFCVKYGCQ